MQPEAPQWLHCLRLLHRVLKERVEVDNVEAARLQRRQHFAAVAVTGVDAPHGLLHAEALDFIALQALDGERCD